MIQISCDRCDRTIEVGDEMAGAKVECPDCGDVNVVPDRPGADARPSPASERRTPESAEERTLLKIYPAMFRARPTTFCFLALLVLAGAIGAITFAVRKQPVYMWLCIVPLAGAVVGLIWWKIRTLSTRLIVTNKRTIRSTGLLSRSTTEVKHEAVRNFQVRQTLWDRLFNVGTIGISSAGQDDIEIVMSDVARPLEVRRIVDGYRDM